MNGRRLLVVAVVSLLLVALTTPISAAPDPGGSYRTDRVLVRLAPDASADLLGPGAGHLFGRWYEVSPRPGEQVTVARQRLQAEPYVEIAELDQIRRLDPQRSVPAPDLSITAVTPNDPFYGLQWHFPAIELPDAWETGFGAGVVVAIVDSGISMAGEDLDCRPLAGEFNAFTDTAGPGVAVDGVGHGTHVAGTVGQCTNNAVGVAGVAGSVSLLAVKVLDTSGGTDAESAQGIAWAAANGADVINLSLGGSCSPPSVIEFDAIDTAIAAGVVVVAASGNGADDVGYTGGVDAPACHPDVIAVGATDYADNRSPYSNWGMDLDVVAPGGDMSVDLNGDGFADGVVQETFSSTDPTDWRYWFKQGTSMASPHVAGTAALLLSANPAATNKQVKKALEVTAVDRGSPGWDMYYGHGLIDADAALDAILDTAAPSWPAGAVVSVTPDEVTADLSWNAAADNVAVTEYRIWLDGVMVKTVTGTSTELTGLLPSTSYSVAVQAADLMGNTTAVGPATPFTTLQSSDTQAPSWPGGSGLEAAIVSDEWVRLEWDAAADNVGVTTYRIYQNGNSALTTSNTYATVEGLAEGTTYQFRVEAGDASGNWSSTGPAISVTTEDYSFPEFPGGGWIRASEVLEDRATFTWAAATDPSGIAEYRVWVDSEYHTTTRTTLQVTGLDPDTQYLAWVEAEDPSGNWSVGPDVWFTTALDFSDTNGSVFETDIAWLSGAGITKGCNPPLNTDFCPDAFVTRGQMAAFMVRALGYTDDGGGDLFTDDDGSVFERDIDRFGTAGITKGCNPPLNTDYCPDAFVTRGQMAAFMVRAFGYTDDGGGNLFTDDDGSVFERDIDRLGTAGITRGCNPPANTSFCPHDRVTRGQMAAFLHRALGGT